MSNFNNHKIYRVRRMTNSSGKFKFQVEAADSWIEALFGLWTEYSKENNSLETAIYHIKSLAESRMTDSKIVFKKHVTKL